MPDADPPDPGLGEVGGEDTVDGKDVVDGEDVVEALLVVGLLPGTLALGPLEPNILGVAVAVDNELGPAIIGTRATPDGKAVVVRGAGERVDEATGGTTCGIGAAAING